MSIEQRIKAYYKAHNQGHRDSFYSGEITSNIYERMARVFKMPIREIRAVLGHPAREPNRPGCRFARLGGSCDGEVTFAPAPYSSEILGNHTPIWMCARCRHKSAMDI